MANASLYCLRHFFPISDSTLDLWDQKRRKEGKNTPREDEKRRSGGGGWTVVAGSGSGGRRWLELRERGREWVRDEGQGENEEEESIWVLEWWWGRFLISES